MSSSWLASPCSSPPPTCCPPLRVAAAALLGAGDVDHGDPNAFSHEFQFIDVGDYKGKGEDQPTPHWMINLGEAEYAVALFMYMRLLGYPAHKISILTTYAGQRSLINDVLGHKCKNNPLFGRPKHVSTVDKYQGEQNDCKSLFYILEERWTDR